jgi:hypothetical protein
MTGIAPRPSEDSGDAVRTLLEAEPFGDRLAGEPLTGRLEKKVEQVSGRGRELAIEPSSLVSIVCRPGACVRTEPTAAMAVAFPFTSWCSPRLGRQEFREPGIELRDAFLWYGNCDLLVRHPLDLGDLRGLSCGLGRSLVGLAPLRPIAPSGTTVAVSVGMAAIFAVPSPSAAARQEPREEGVELRQALLGDVYRDLLVSNGGGF